MSSPSVDQRNPFVGAIALLVLLLAGVVLATSWLVPIPGFVLATAWLIAFVGMAFVVVATFRAARSTGIGYVAALGRSFKALGRFVLWWLFDFERGEPVKKGSRPYASMGVA